MDDNIMVNVLRHMDGKCALAFLQSTNDVNLFRAAKQLGLIYTLPWESVKNIEVQFTPAPSLSKPQKRRLLKSCRKAFQVDTTHLSTHTGAGVYGTSEAHVLNENLRRMQDNDPLIVSSMATRDKLVTLYTSKKASIATALEWLRTAAASGKLHSDECDQVFKILVRFKDDISIKSVVSDIRADPIKAATKLVILDMPPFKLGPLNIMNFLKQGYYPDRCLRSTQVSMSFSKTGINHGLRLLPLQKEACETLGFEPSSRSR